MTAKPTKSREIILSCLIQILEKGKKSNAVLSEALSKNSALSKPDRSFITRVTEGVTERLFTIDRIINLCSSTDINKMKPVIREILRLSVYQILYMDRVPDRAVISEAVNLSKAHGYGGLSGFVNGVLRTVSRQKETFDFSEWEEKYSMPSFITDRWREAYGEEKTELILKGLLNERLLSVHAALSRASLNEVEESLLNQGVTVVKSPYSDRILLLSDYDTVEKLDAFKEGLIYVQDLSSSFVGAVSGIKGGELVVDVCAAPGGKSLDMADRLKGSGQVLAFDVSEKKVKQISENAARMHMKNIAASVKDARVPDKALEGKADLVIADLPCSGFGIIGKKPDIKLNASEEKCRDLTNLQREIISAAISYVRPRGRFIYTTCTINREENEGQREFILNEYPFRPVPLSELSDEFSESETLSEGYIQFLPGIDACDGFFLSVFERET